MKYDRYINDKKIFKDETLQALPWDGLKEFRELITNYNVIKQTTNLLDRISIIIDNKLNSEKSEALDFLDNIFYMSVLE